MLSLFSIKDFSASTNNKQILKDINLNIAPGQIHAIMGPNGSGKSTLALTLMGHPKYKITNGTITLNGKDITALSPDQRAKAGLFLAFQNPHEIEGISLRDFLRQSYNALHKGTDKELSPLEFRNLLSKKIKLLKVKPDFVERSINYKFSGGEKKRAEILQLAVLQPKLAILDEIDSGLDIDALKIVCDGINSIKKENPKMSLLIITHYPRILSYLKPSVVHVLQNGSIIKSGDKSLALALESEGYKNI